MLEDNEQEHYGLDIIECTRTGKFGKKITSKKYITEILMKREENNSKKEGERIMIRKT